MSITYDVLYRKHGDPSWITFTNTALTTITVTGLDPNTQYDFEVQAINEAGRATSNIVQQQTLGGLTINSITLSNQTFTAGSAIGTQVGTISVGMSSGSFVGSLAVGGTDAASFQIVGSALQLKVNNTTARTYNINIVATQTSPVVDNSPFTQNFPSITGNPSIIETGEGFAVTAPGTSIYASTTMGSPQSTGPWDQFDLIGPSNDQQITLLHPGQSSITTTSGGVVKLVYSNHTVFQQNNAVPAGWWYWNTAAAFGASNWVEYGVNVLTVTTQTYPANAGANTQVATMSVTMKDGNAFTGTFTVSDTTNFKIVGSAVQAKVTLTAGSYPNVTVTAIPRVSADGTATQIGEQASQMVTIAQTGVNVQPILGSYTGTWMGNSGTFYGGVYSSQASHYAGFINALSKTPVVIGCGLNSLSSDSGFSTAPSTWAGQMSVIMSTVIGVTGSSIVPSIAWPFSYDDSSLGGSTQLLYSQLASGALDTNITDALAEIKAAGINKAYLRPAWEFNLTNPAGVSGNLWIVNAGNVASFRGALRRFYTTAHTWAAANAFSVRVCWNPSVYGGVNESDSSLTLAQMFPNQTAGEQFVDVVCADFYAVGSSYATDAIPNARTFNIKALVGLCQTWSCTLGFCELGGTLDGRTSTGGATTWLPDLVSYLNTLKTLTPTVPVELLVLWDNNAGVIPPEVNTMEFSARQTANQQGMATGWRNAMGPSGGGSILSVPYPT